MVRLNSVITCHMTLQLPDMPCRCLIDPQYPYTAPDNYSNTEKILLNIMNYQCC